MGKKTVPLLTGNVQISSLNFLVPYVNPVLPSSVILFCVIQPNDLLIVSAKEQQCSREESNKRKRGHKVLTHMLLPKMHYGSLLLPGSSGPRKRRLPRPVCSVFHERCEGRKASHWAAACGENVGHLCRFPPALRPCTTPLSGLAVPLLYSWEWRAPLWRQSGQRGAPQSGVGSPPAADGILEEKDEMQFTQRRTPCRF